MRRLFIPVLGLSTIVALSACNVGGSDKGGKGDSSTMSTTGDGDGDGDGTDTGTGTGDGDGDGDGDTICGDVMIPDWVTEECIFQMIAAVAIAELSGNEGAAEEACAIIREAAKIEAIHSADGIPGPAGIPWLFFKALFINHFVNGDDGAVQPRELDELGLQTGLAAIEDDFPCGDGPNGFTVCGGEPWVDGDVVVVAGATEEDIPLDQADWNVEFSAVFDADGNTSNNYVADPAYPNDFFQDTDQWYVARYTPGVGWELAVSTAVDSDIQSMGSAARVVFSGNAVMWIIPASELGVACPDWRVTSFAHKGDYGINPPNEWSGRLEPPVSMGLNACD